MTILGGVFKSLRSIAYVVLTLVLLNPSLSKKITVDRHWSSNIYLYYHHIIILGGGGGGVVKRLITYFVLA